MDIEKKELLYLAIVGSTHTEINLYFEDCHRTNKKKQKEFLFQIFKYYLTVNSISNLFHK